MKICNRCKNKKDLEEYYKDRTSKDGYDSRCKNCRSEYGQENREKILIKTKEYYENHKEEQSNRMKLWRLNNPEKQKEILLNYELNNKEKIREYHRKYDKENMDYKIKWFNNKYKNDLNFRLLSLIRVRINSSIKNNKKTHPSLYLLGCSIEEARLHLEDQFLPEMNWSNHGKVWEIDHIIPCSSFNLENLEEQKECFHYSNLQPLFKTTATAESLGYKGYVGNRDKYNKICHIKN